MSTRPIPENIETLAVRLANEEAARAAYARSEKGRQAIARRLRTEAAAKGMPVKEYIEALTKDPQGVTPPEGTAPTSAFWSFGIDHPDAPTNRWDQNFLDNRYIAEAWATVQNEQQQGSARTLETTEAGRQLNSMYLWEPEVLEALGGAEKGFTEDWTRNCWGTISETYATTAKGPVAVFAQYADTRSILYNRELPTLHTNTDVGLDNIHFAYEAPQPWPKETRAEVGTDAARAQLQYNDPTKAHYVDPKTYPDQDPTARRTALESEFASVTAERVEGAAAKKVERATGRTPEVAQAQQAEKQTNEGNPQPAVQAKEQGNPKLSASVPLWQLGFTPKLVAVEPGSSGPTAAATAPPTPDLQKQNTGPGLG
ncbi:hypothetical protein [Streptomyces sp. ME18-1-4]|uniref:hypothetical protein n=1 Tax=Streptomyces sp. ME18-1-4 TaxID=3028685 RepID=UPI0029AC1D98|nr:hypothetical protein [Streptomyces sp. ME18-1-4]MDX3249216.1 hypothetical protein [Streptomyces sp. ME18-1-4]